MFLLGVVLVIIVYNARPVAAALVIPAQDAAVKTVGTLIDGGAGAAGSSWGLYTDGEVGDHLRIPRTGRYRVIVRAKGSPSRGGWPLMTLMVDGLNTESATVGRDQFADYEFAMALSAGVHRVTVAFVNDEFNPPTEDRNLFLNRLEIRPLAGAGEAVRASVDDWRLAARERESATLAATKLAIERVRQGDVVIRVVDARGAAVRDAQVTVELVRHEFLFGGNFFKFQLLPTPAQNEQYQERFAALFNYATLGFYWRWYEPRRGEPNYPATDRAVAWCRAHGIRLKGHPLLWNQEAGVPVWWDHQPDADTQRQRVTEIMQRYHGQIEFWEVVNEPAHLPGLDIDEPYRWARAADPAAHLIVNDYGIMAFGCPECFELLQAARARNVPFDGIGIQAHDPSTQWFPMDVVQHQLDHYATLGKDLHITEFTPLSAGEPISGGTVTGRWDEATQADFAVKFYRTCFAHPAVVAITWWDFCDSGSWRPGAGMLRADLSPKPVYDALRRLIHEEWHTRAEGAVDRAGRFRFRGFYGQYAVQVSRQGRTWPAEFRLARGPGRARLTTWEIQTGEPPR